MIPPAWEDVWVTPYENGHLQAVGTDEAGRRQYLYHPDWRSRRDAEKFDRVLQFGKALSRARERVLTDLGTEGMALERACAVAVRLLDLGYFRIGNDVYADKHGSFGLTTLERRHVRRQRRPAGLRVRRQVRDRAPRSRSTTRPRSRRSRSMRRRRGGEDRLLAWKDGRRWRSLDSGAVNDYVRETTGLEATAKDFRTWHATVLAAAALAETDEPGESQGVAQAGGLGGDEGGRGVPRQHPDPGPLVVRRPARRRRLRGGQHHRRRHPRHYDEAPTSARPPWSGRVLRLLAAAVERTWRSRSSGRHHRSRRSTRW